MNGRCSSFVVSCSLAILVGAATGNAAASLRMVACSGTDSCMESGGGTYENGELVGMDCDDHSALCGSSVETCALMTYVGFTGTFNWCACPGSDEGLSGYNAVYECCIAKVKTDQQGNKEFRCSGTNCTGGQTCTAGGIPMNGAQSCNCSS